MLHQLGVRLREVASSIAPLVVVACLLQLVLVKAPPALFVQFLGGALLAVAGLVLFFIGIDLGVLPMGRFIGAELPRRGSLALLAAVTFALGFVTTVAEPDVLVLSRQVEALSRPALRGQVVRYAIAAGLAAFAVVAMLRVIRGTRLALLLTAAYGAVIALALVAPPAFVPLAFDAGSVTTGALSAPVLIALVLGLSSVLAGRGRLADGFGLLGFASIGPIVAVLLMGILR